jgi:hypothetical protein
VTKLKADRTTLNNHSAGHKYTYTHDTGLAQLSTHLGLPERKPAKGFRALPHIRRANEVSESSPFFIYATHLGKPGECAVKKKNRDLTVFKGGDDDEVPDYIHIWHAKQLKQIKEMLANMETLEDPEEGDEQRVLAVLKLFLVNFPKIRKHTWDEIREKYKRIARQYGWENFFARCTAVCLMPRKFGGHNDAHFCVRKLGHKGNHKWDCGYEGE